ncbi:fibronectin type III domain-containing protein [Paramaledivibacter caminithermalis]|uniref:Fibronectin type-III domain-containing protein n=1 Tax=Paramaledivibacter caminithermalis (strain DSM 15212 / CIP 107654 / DViRD3) TaxID=1121301 RepID=A0A1M6K5T1_PARC5|nr:fibronectin type III domain-containing protein [Paramaledivibacter caminithermalis]SHJ54308.1 hypothetical protein SAMN02745912_00276 [Paramaledivibacter caminithermalis DSM 15212]
MKKLVLLLTILLVFNLLGIQSFAISYIGLLDSESYTMSQSNVRYELSRIVDNVANDSWSNGCGFEVGSYIDFIFDEIQDIDSVVYDTSMDYNMKIIFYGENGLVIYEKSLPGAASGGSINVQVEGVKRVRLYRYSGSGRSLFEEIDFTPMLPKMGDLVCTYDTAISKINLSWNDLGEGVTYKLYLNNNLIETFDNSTLNYTINNLTSNTTYEIKIIASKEGYRDAVFIDNITTLNYFSFSPTNTDSNVGDTWINVKWDEVSEAIGYQVQIDDGEIINVNDLSYRFEELQSDTSYTVKIRTAFEGDLYSDWTIINAKTLLPPEVPPYKPDSLEILQVDTDSVKVKVSDTLYADSYIWYLNNNMVAETTEREYTFTGLKENTSYSVACRAKNEYGESRFPVSRLVKTLEIPKPKVTSVSTQNAGYSAGGGLIKQVTWDSENVEEGFELYVDGALVGEYDALTNEAALNFEELGLEDGYHDIEIRPKDADGVGYKVRITNQGTDNEDMDQVVGFMDKALQVIKKGGIYFLIILISFGLSMFGAQFLFNKFKLSLVTTTPEQLEAEPDEAMSVDFKKKDGMDKQFKEIADRAEDGYFRNKKENIRFDKNIKQENKEAKVITRYVPKYRMKNKTEMVVKVSAGYRNIDLGDLDNYLKYARMNEYDKQLIKNAVEDWKKKSNFNKFVHISSNNKKLTLGGYKMKEEKKPIEGGVKNNVKKTEEEVIREYENKILNLAKNKTT